MPSGPPSVFLVDDNATFLRHAERFLGRDGALEVVGTATSVAAAVPRLRELRPAVVLLDLFMPGTDGIQGIPIVLEAAPEAVVVMLTMHAGLAYREQALAHGAHGFVTKTDLVVGLRAEIARLVPWT